MSIYNKSMYNMSIYYIICPFILDTPSKGCRELFLGATNMEEEYHRLSYRVFIRMEAKLI